jgi:hypothetical protein
MKRIRILHETEYQYRQPVKFGPPPGLDATARRP